MSARATRRGIIIAVLLQALVLCLLPLLAGERIPSGTTIMLTATAGSEPEFQKDMPSQEVWLDYAALDALDVPSSVGAGDTVFVQVRASGEAEPARLGPVIADESALPEGSIWITLPTMTSRDGEVVVDADPIRVWFDEDRERIDALRNELEDGGRVRVTVELDNDGDPTIESVRVVE